MFSNTGNEQEEQKAVLIKFVFIGDKNTGRSNTVLRYIENVFVELYIPIIPMDFKIKSFEDLDSEYTLYLQVWDRINDWDRFRLIAPTFYKNASAVFVFFDITNRESFNHVEKEIKDFQRINQLEYELYIVGNKIDLENKRVISREEGYQLAQANAAQYFEISAKENINIHPTFDEIAKAMFYKKINDLKTNEPSVDPPVSKSYCIIQ
ncbi:hypothetical protein CYY_002261 [Polysphondylium violaceum]|uniref:Rab GTPase n=1 Tax=Polysphondylium violaceum TaxID=133409 RepID=A0A8J4PX48_9MYCE|nr:hypothetical protein CYY_002261 [Polysphondylium violaceum]